MTAKRCLGSPETAPTGQALWQRRHPMQRLGSMRATAKGSSRPYSESISRAGCPVSAASFSTPFFPRCTAVDFSSVLGNGAGVLRASVKAALAALGLGQKTGKAPQRGALWCLVQTSQTSEEEAADIRVFGNRQQARIRARSFRREAVRVRRFSD